MDFLKNNKNDEHFDFEDYYLWNLESIYCACTLYIIHLHHDIHLRFVEQHRNVFLLFLLKDLKHFHVC